MHGRGRQWGQEPEASPSAAWPRLCPPSDNKRPKMGESTVNNRAYLRAMRNAALNNHSFGEVNAQRAKARGVYLAEEAFTLSGHHEI